MMIPLASEHLGSEIEEAFRKAVTFEDSRGRKWQAKDDRGAVEGLSFHPAKKHILWGEKVLKPDHFGCTFLLLPLDPDRRYRQVKVSMCYFCPFGGPDNEDILMTDEVDGQEFFEEEVCFQRIVAALH